MATVQTNAGTVPMIQPNRNTDEAIDSNSEDKIYDDDLFISWVFKATKDKCERYVLDALKAHWLLAS